MLLNNYTELFMALDEFNLTFNEYFLIKMILGFQEGKGSIMYDASVKYFNLNTTVRGSIGLMMSSLVEKGYLKNVTKLSVINDLHKVEFNKTFLKKFYKPSNKMGEEFKDSYPDFAIINGVEQNIKTVGNINRYNSIDEVGYQYAKAIGWNVNKHQHILELIDWGKSNGYNFPGMGLFVANREWEAIDKKKNGGMFNATPLQSLN